MNSVANTPAASPARQPAARRHAAEQPPREAFFCEMLGAALKETRQTSTENRRVQASGEAENTEQAQPTEQEAAEQANRVEDETPETSPETPTQAEEPTEEQLAAAASMVPIAPEVPADIPAGAAPSAQAAIPAVTRELPQQPGAAAPKAQAAPEQTDSLPPGQAREPLQQPSTKAPQAQMPEAEEVSITLPEQARETRTEVPPIHRPAQGSPQPAQEKFDRMVQDATRELEQAKAQQPVREALPEAEPAAVKAEALPEQNADAAVAVKREKEENTQASSMAVSQTAKEAQAPPFAEVKEVQRPFPAPDPAEQVRFRMLESLETEKMEFRMQLQPEEFGKVNVRMVLESGKLTVEIVTESAKAAQALQRQADTLAASLRGQGIDLDRIQIVSQTQQNSTYSENTYHMGGEFQRDSEGQAQRADQEHAEKLAAQGSAGEETEHTQPAAPQQLLDYAI